MMGIFYNVFVCISPWSCTFLLHLKSTLLSFDCISGLFIHYHCNTAAMIYSFVRTKKKVERQRSKVSLLDTGMQVKIIYSAILNKVTPYKPRKG